MTSAVRLRLFKLRVFDSHCHIVATHDDRGEAIDLPGVDLRGAEATSAFEMAAPLFEKLGQQASDRQLRAMSLHLERRRLLATFEPMDAEKAPTVVRIDDGEAYRHLLSVAQPVIQYLADCAASRFAGRRDAPATVPPPLVVLTPQELERSSANTLGHYNGGAASFWQGTRGHDVSQNITSLLKHLAGEGPHTILDLGCGPGRDLIAFRDLGHLPVGLDGARRFVEMAREHSGCEVLHQNFMALELPAQHFDGIFANASLFHVPSQELPRVLGELRESLKDEGILFASNPHGPNREGWSGERYGCFLDLDTFRGYMTRAGFHELEHYYRPFDRPRHAQPWLASVWQAWPR